MADVSVKSAIESAVKSGKFGDDVKFLDLVPSNSNGKDQFASEVVFAQVKLEGNSGIRYDKVVIKKPAKMAHMRKMLHSDEQFYNEHLMYSEILPFLEKNKVVSDLYPKGVHTHATLGENFEEDIIVVEDLSPLEFKLADDKVFLDFDHCSIALKNLGRFHALSYATKQENLDEFLKVAKKLKNVTFGDDSGDNVLFLQKASQRGILPLKESGEFVEVLDKFLDRIADPEKILEQQKLPEEPMAVICHGDFNRNNIFFKYGDDGKPTNVKFFDMATSCYASPAIDLTFFLTMNTTSKIRHEHWDDLLQIYHEALSSTIPDCKVPSLEDLHAEVRRKAAYGYVISSFFIPMMMDNFDKDEMDNYDSIPPEVFAELAMTRGGEECTQILVDLARDLVTFNCV